ncbi:MAG: stage III sporulation protein AE, partial [Lachnospiraceae bacterium]|nr:stage III sporulation protein AE [Lachnospiraceae bacterium]
MNRIIFMVVIFVLLNTSTVYAVEIEQYDFTDIDRVLKENDEKIDFEDTVIRIGRGDTGIFTELIDNTMNSLKNEMVFAGDNVKRLIVISIFAGIIMLVSDLFNNSGIGDAGFGIVYMITSGIVTAGFAYEIEIVENVMQILMEFMKTLLPTYLFAVSTSGQAMTASMFYELTMIIIFAIEWLFFKVFIPMVKIYVIISVVDYMSKERILSKFAEIIKKIIGWILKTSVYAVAGVNLVEGIVFPSIDSATVSNVSRVASSVPGMDGV